MNNYVGNKGGQTILPILANHIPKAKRYFSFFLGAGGLEFSEHFIDCNWIVSEKRQDLQLKAAASAAIVYESYQNLVANFDFNADDFVFCDPPYLHSTRRNARLYYIYEWQISDHVEFLHYISSCNAKVLLTHPFCDLYDNALSAFHKIPFAYQTRQALFNDGIYINYDSASVELKTYNFLGKCRTNRQQIKRSINNTVAKIERLPFHQKMAIFEKLQIKSWQSSN